MPDLTRTSLELDPDWAIGGRAHGGYLLRLVAEAGLTTQHPDPLTVSAAYIRSPSPGTATLEVEVLRTGRRVTSSRVRLSQGGDVVVEALVTAGVLAAPEPFWSDALLPEVAPLEHCTRVPASRVDGLRVGHLEHVELRLDPSSFPFPGAAEASGGLGEPVTAGTAGGPQRSVTHEAAGDAPRESAEAGTAGGEPLKAAAAKTTGSLPGKAVRAEARGWLRRADGADASPLDLLVFADALPPVTFALGLTGWVPTVELTVHLRALPAPSWVRGIQRARLLQDGWLDEEVELWDSAGRLVCQARQLAGYRPG